MAKILRKRHSHLKFHKRHSYRLIVADETGTILHTISLDDYDLTKEFAKQVLIFDIERVYRKLPVYKGED